MQQQNLFGNAALPAPRPNESRKPAARVSHTCFFALRPGPEDAARIHEFAGKLLMSCGISGSRITPERLHITLELVGHDANETVVDAACRAADAVRVSAFKAQFDTAGSFLAPNGPFVLVGTEGMDRVRVLHTSLGCAMADQGFAPSRAYQPHMTLCYDQRHRVAFAPIASIGFHVSEFALVKSHIGQSRHEVLPTWQLAS